MSGGSFNLINPTGAVDEGRAQAPQRRGSLTLSDEMAPTWPTPGSKHRRHTAEAGTSTRRRRPGTDLLLAGAAPGGTCRSRRSPRWNLTLPGAALEGI